VTKFIAFKVILPVEIKRIAGLDDEAVKFRLYGEEKIADACSFF
jgi:hypothetical protein